MLKNTAAFSTTMNTYRLLVSSIILFISYMDLGSYNQFIKDYFDD
jgi:hypothetical protein